MTKKSLIALTALLAGFSCQLTHAEQNLNGRELNGLGLNGLGLNGLGLNGVNENGLSVQGKHVNGLSVQGKQTNGLNENGRGGADASVRMHNSHALAPLPLLTVRRLKLADGTDVTF